MTTVLSWNEIRDRATKFAREWKAETREAGEYQTFWNDFFEIFGIRRRSVALYQEAVKRHGKGTGFIDLFWAGKLIAEHKSAGQDLDSAYTQAREYAESLPEEKCPRYIIVTDYATMRLYDLEGEKGIEVQEFPLTELPKQVRLFGFIAGYEVRKYREEDPVNRKAVKLVVNLYKELAKSNYNRPNLEKLLVRLVFCFFADDAAIFPQNEPFKYYLALGGNEDGSDFGSRLENLFSTLDTLEGKRQTTLDERLAELPYVNGGLFKEHLPVVFFNREMRRAVLDACDFNWAAVSPAIFGSMFQYVTDVQNAAARHDLGAHYTSEKNILKVIDGLFMDDLRAEFTAAGKNKEKLHVLWEKLGAISLLDPACGCGNFLVVAYRELRRLELEILKRLHPETRAADGAGQSVLPMDVDAAKLSKLSVEHMYGIELESFPAEIAKLSLWLTDHLANLELGDYFGKPFRKLPLTESPHIVCGNALTIDWETVVPKKKLSYILGNPPFVSKQDRSSDQKADMERVFGKLKGAGELDYVTAWYLKAAEYMRGTHIAASFVSTNSITQGEQAGILWPELFKRGVKIRFAHRTFRWSNEAPGRAAVFCIIVGFEIGEPERRRLFEYIDPSGEPHEVAARNINPYLVDADDVVVTARRKPISPNVPSALFGSMPNDAGQFLFDNEAEKNVFLIKEPKALKFIHPLVSAKEYLQGGKKYCLWLKDALPEEIRTMPEVRIRVENVRVQREMSSRAATRELAQTPYLWGEDRQPSAGYILIPRVSSERRRYIPFGFFMPETIAGDTCIVVPKATSYHFGVLQSEMHMTWMRAVAGRLKSDYRYSNELVYNNFPWPENVSDERKKETEEAAQAVLDARAKFPNSTLADLYDPSAMPKELLDAHHRLDHAVDLCYGINKQFTTEAARLEFLFGKYQEFTK